MSYGPNPRRTEHPYVVNSLAELPVELSKLALKSLPDSASIETIFVVPSQYLTKAFGSRQGSYYIPQSALIFTEQGLLLTKESTQKEQDGKSIYIQKDQLFYMHLVLILLYSRLELLAVVNDKLERIVLEYNTVGHELLEPALQRLLQRAWVDPLEQTATYDLENEPYLDALNKNSLKFRNGLRIYGIQPGECLSGYVYQPRITKRFLGLFPRILVPGGVAAFTQNEFVLIEEGNTNPTSYGWYILICPRDYISELNLQSAKDLSDVRISLTKSNISAEHQVMWQNTNAQALYSLWRKTVEK